MKKLLTVLSCMTLSSVSVLSVTSCTSKNDYDSIFDQNKPQDENKGDFIVDGPDQIIKKLENIVSKKVVVNVSVKSATNKIQKSNFASEEKIIKELISNIKEQANITENGFTITIDSNNSFSLPELKGLSSDGITFDNDASLVYGQAFLRLNYLDKEIYTKVFEWTIPEYEVIENVINILQVNSYANVGDYKSKKIDIPLADLSGMGIPLKITLGTIHTFISLLNITNSSNSFSSTKSGTSTDWMTAILTPIKKIVNLNVQELADANPNDANGQYIYNEFDKNFRKYFKDLFGALGGVLKTLGMQDSIKIPASETKPEVVIKISELLDTNIFDIVNFDPDSIAMNQDLGMGLSMKMTAKIGSKGQNKKLLLGDLLANVAPNIVHIFAKFLNPKTYKPEFGGSHNLLYMLLKELITDMDPNLLKINEKNNPDHLSASNAKSGVDSLLFNLMLDYNKNRRKTENLNLYIHLNLDLSGSVIGGTKKVFDDNLYEVLQDIKVVPGEMVLKIINRLFNFEGKNFLELDELFLSPNLKIEFFENSDINLEAIVERMDLDTIRKPIIQAAVPLIKSTITDKLNGAMNSFLPEMSMQKIINRFPGLLINELGVDKRYLDNAQVTFKKAKFVFQFYSSESKEWTSVTKGINSRTFEIYSSFKLKVVEAQFLVKVNTQTNSFEYLTKKDLTFDIIFSDQDK
ncbi:hypothetical protein [Spiroplasma floricola]|uniref:MOLPALP family lipoprotein n=1 Tax=Spiroplasma floricola 23-6 TaxID=1336749 RepID=A0A2K8SE71_9MOLU|nr:hypothetical protein [Spiroplasma floricola]AUB31713.1 hypothetical protein SFLOR_v1c06630 [Spiroplasma floricola 23-6]